MQVNTHFWKVILTHVIRSHSHLARNKITFPPAYSITDKVKETSCRVKEWDREMVHHQERIPDWGIAVCTSLLHAFRSCARCQAERRQMLHDFRSASKVGVQVWAGSLLRFFQSCGGLLIAAWRAWQWSISGPACATWPISDAVGNGWSRTEVDNLCNNLWDGYVRLMWASGIHYLAWFPSDWHGRLGSTRVFNAP